MDDNKNMSEKQFLESYDIHKYERPSVTVDMLIFTINDEENSNYRKLPEKALKLLMIKRGRHPYLGEWALPGGFVGINESLDAAVERELKEETGIENIYMEQLYTWGEVMRDPRTRVISTSYLSLVNSISLELKASDDAEDARWFTVSYKLFQEHKQIIENGSIQKKQYHIRLTSDAIELSATVQATKTVEGKVSRMAYSIIESNGIAFDHAKIIHYGIERLKNKIEYTNIAFNLMSESFTLTELQQVYEIILDTELLKANFRRKVAQMVIETDQYTKDAGHRPSKLFKFNQDWHHL